MPIFSMSSDRLGENPLEVRASARTWIGLVARVVDRDLDQRGDVRLRDRTLRLVSGQRCGDREIAFERREPVYGRRGARLLGVLRHADDMRELGHLGAR